MTLTLAITNAATLANGNPITQRLDRRGLVIGRSASADWSLPDQDRYISSTHCEIDFRDGAYWLTDRSTNGTFVNAGESRLDGPHRLADGDVISIGQYDIVCSLQGDGVHGVTAAPTAEAPSDWSWPTPAPTPKPEPAAAVWVAPEEESAAPSAWSDPVSPGSDGRSTADIWDDLASSNAVDWLRGGFGGAPSEPFAAAPVDDPFPPMAAPAPRGRASAEPGWRSDPSSRTPESVSTTAPPVRGFERLPSSGGGELKAFLDAVGIPADALSAPPHEVMGAAGALLRRLIAGMVVMLEARTRAKAQLGARGTSLALNGNNPLKFALTPQRALAQMLNPPERGFMGAEQAVEDAFKDLQAHQMATLAAMQAALGATLARFSPDAIRRRAETRGLLAKIVPSAREAALWKAYEREFEGVARGSDEAFMDVFAKEFRQAYEEAAARMKDGA